MGYQHITNLYRPEAQVILLFKEIYALEKIHGTSAHIKWNGSEVSFFAGGSNHTNFVLLFNAENLKEKLLEIFGDKEVFVYGEAYGGKIQGMRKTYGEQLRFVAFDVKVDKVWLNVPNAEQVVQTLGLDFVPYTKVSTDLTALDTERDSSSVQATKNGIIEPKTKEGIVLRPLVEMTTNNGERVIAKHKGDQFKETLTKREVDPNKLVTLEQAEAIATEWVTEMRLTHVLDKLENPTDISLTGTVVKAMVEDVLREASNEIVDSKDARKAIGSLAAKLYKRRISQVLIQNEVKHDPNNLY